MFLITTAAAIGEKSSQGVFQPSEVRVTTSRERRLAPTDGPVFGCSWLSAVLARLLLAPFS
jgi:hypothetical protein